MRTKLCTSFIMLGLLAAVHSVSAQPLFTVLKNFNFEDGVLPLAGMTVSGNTLYGTAWEGGPLDNGTLFKVNTDGTNYTVLCNFSNTLDGANPVAVPLLSGNTLYCTTQNGGSNGVGTVFAVNTDGTGYRVLHHFSDSPDGSQPVTDLAISGDTLYGTTTGGGSDSGSAGRGTVFKLNTNGTGYAVLYNFTNVSDGGQLYSGVVVAGGTLYGTTYQGGTAGFGTIFKVNTDGTGYAVLRNFTNNPDGAFPDADLTIAGGTLYGTTGAGGSAGVGTVFKIDTNGANFKVLKNCTFTDGEIPAAGLTLSGSMLYGTTYYGGSENFGTLFQVNTNGNGYTVLKSFTSAAGKYPSGVLVLSGSTLYGTAFQGGSGDNGTVFSLNLGLNLTTIPGHLVLSWPDAVYSLQAGPDITGSFTNLPGATSPYTNLISGGRGFFRLISNF